MKVVIIEDVKLAANQLQKMIESIRSEYTVVAKLTDIEDSVYWLKNNTADLIFLDIQLSDGLSFKIFDEITIDTPIIFTTAYNQYAIKAFKLNSIDYLLKPIQLENLQQSIEKFERLQGNLKVDIKEFLNTYESQKTQYLQRITVRYNNKIKAINTNDIAWLNARGNDVKIMLKQQKEYFIDNALDFFEQNLNPELFFRINRQYIINYSAIDEMELYSKSKLLLTLIPATDEQAFVSLARYTDFKSWLNK